MNINVGESLYVLVPLEEGEGVNGKIVYISFIDCTCIFIYLYICISLFLFLLICLYMNIKLRELLYVLVPLEEREGVAGTFLFVCVNM
jgi:hypothetical protein